MKPKSQNDGENALGGGEIEVLPPLRGFFIFAA
jgi:hypothetical protein